jgi:glycosyltransferase involved in cell wall biosynthesis
MRVLHVVKTTEGAEWAVRQAVELIKLGVEVHVALPTPKGLCLKAWIEARAKIHIVPLDFPVKAPWRLPEICRSARKLVSEVAPDLIHSHFVGTTLVLRISLGRDHPVPRTFQIPGPLHLEHRIPRALELSTAGGNDYWICSSRCIWRHYERAGIPASRLFLSFYGGHPWRYPAERTYVLRDMLGIAKHELVVGNVSWMYPPKYYLGQRIGLKCHEDLIDALAAVIRRRSDVVGVLAGGAWGGASWYEERLRARAKAAAGDRIKMPGFLPHDLVRCSWPDFDCAVHVPLSENYGGAVEPLLAGVPTIAGRVGALPEVVIDGVTGKTVPVRRPAELADAVLEVLENLDQFRAMARTGQKLVSRMFDVRRTAQEVYRIYHHLLDPSGPRPEAFDPCQSGLGVQPSLNGRQARGAADYDTLTKPLCESPE